MIRPFRSTYPTIHPSAYVDISAQVIGDVHLGPESSVWMNVVVRGDVNRVRVGARCNIQDLTLVHVMRETHPTLIGDDVTIGHGAVVHGCRIDDDCLIGMNATVLNGAVVGSGSLVAAGAVVLEGTVIPPRSLVAGVPAKVRRELTDDELAGIRRNAETYVMLAAQHRELREP